MWNTRGRRASVAGRRASRCPRAMLSSCWPIFGIFLGVQPARAQMVAESMHASTPDWGSGRAVGLLLMLCAMALGGSAILALLARRRDKHPITGLGFVLLLMQGCSALVAHRLLGIAAMAYPGQRALHTASVQMTSRSAHVSVCLSAVLPV
jgi:hypothetical protein